MLSKITISAPLNILFFLGIKSRPTDDETSFQHGRLSKSVPNLHFVSSNLHLYHEQSDRYKKHFRPLRLFTPFKENRLKLAYYPLPWKSKAMELRHNRSFADFAWNNHESDDEVSDKLIKLDDEALKNPAVSDEVSDKDVNLVYKGLNNPDIHEEVRDKHVKLDNEALKNPEMAEEVSDKHVNLDDEAQKNPEVSDEVSDKHIKLDENCSRKFEFASTYELGLYFAGQGSGEKNADSEISRSYLPSSKHTEHTRIRSKIMKSQKEDNHCSSDDTEDNYNNEVDQLLEDEEIFSKNQESLKISGTYSAQCIYIDNSDPDETDNETTLPEPPIEDAQGNLKKEAYKNVYKDAHKNIDKDVQENLYKDEQKNPNKDAYKNLNSLMDPKTISPGLSGFKAQHKPHDLGFVCVNNTHDSTLHWNMKVHKRGPINPNSEYFFNANIRPERRDILNPPVRPELRKLSSAERHSKLKESQSSLNPGMRDSLNKENPRDLTKLQECLKALVYPRPGDCLSPTTLTTSKVNCNTQMYSESPEDFCSGVPLDNKNSVYCSECRSSSSPNLTPGIQFNTDPTRYYPIQPNHGKHRCSTQGVSDDKGGQETPDIHRYPFNTDLIRPYTTKATYEKSLNKIRRIEYEHDYGTRGRMHQLHSVNLSDLNQKKNIKSQGSIHKYSQFKNEKQVQRYTGIITFTYLQT